MNFRKIMMLIAVTSMAVGSLSGCSAYKKNTTTIASTVEKDEISTSEETTEGDTEETTTSKYIEETRNEGYYYVVKDKNTGEEKKIVVTIYYSPVIMVLTDEVEFIGDVKDGDKVLLTFDCAKTDYDEWGYWTDGFHDIADCTIEKYENIAEHEVRDKYPWLEDNGLEGSWKKLTFDDGIPHPQFCTADLKEYRYEEYDASFIYNELEEADANRFDADKVKRELLVDEETYSIWLVDKYLGGDTDPYGLTIDSQNAEFILYIENKSDDLYGINYDINYTMNEEKELNNYRYESGIEMQPNSGAYHFIYAHNGDEGGNVESLTLNYKLGLAGNLDNVELKKLNIK